MPVVVCEAAGATQRRGREQSRLAKSNYTNSEHPEGATIRGPPIDLDRAARFSSERYWMCGTEVQKHKGLKSRLA